MIYLVRHGEAASAWGEHPDPGLSARGKLQAAGVGKTLLDSGATSLICSPMQRCQETAVPFATLCNVTPKIVPAVSEIVTPDHVTDRVLWLRGLMQGAWPDNLLPWCRAAYNTVASLPDETVVFSHFVAINAIIGQITGQPDVLVFKPGHCSITVLQLDGQGGLSLESLGDEASTKVL
jgi:broad specificity phosphatase PhoE